MNAEKKPILEKIEELKKAYFELKMSFWLGKPNINTSFFKKTKKEIARIKTAATANK